MPEPQMLPVSPARYAALEKHLQANGQETDMNDDRCERCGRPVPDDWDLTAVPVDPDTVRLSLRELEPGETVTDYMLLCERCQDNEGAV